MALISVWVLVALDSGGCSSLRPPVCCIWSLRCCCWLQCLQVLHSLHIRLLLIKQQWHTVAKWDSASKAQSIFYMDNSNTALPYWVWYCHLEVSEGMVVNLEIHLQENKDLLWLFMSMWWMSDSEQHENVTLMAYMKYEASQLLAWQVPVWNIW